MADAPATKKVRVWNPAIDNQQDYSSPNTTTSKSRLFEDVQDGGLSFKQQPTMLPMFLQNYVQFAPLVARLHQQQQMEQMVRQRMLASLAAVQQKAHKPPTVTTSVETTVTPTSGTTTVAMVNPIVASAMGVTNINENCCAICGSTFRLTGDLVQHMRNNHRRTRFKRKNEKTIE